MGAWCQGTRATPWAKPSWNGLTLTPGGVEQFPLGLSRITSMILLLKLACGGTPRLVTRPVELLANVGGRKTSATRQTQVEQ